jgi:arylsulfatase A-like enzyme
MAACLFLVLVVAKIAILWGRPLPLSPWAPLAFIWQDLAIALLFFGYERVVRQRWAVRSLYGALLLLTVANVPVALVLSTPLTAAMLKAARATLSDSFWYHATPVNLAITGLVAVVGIALPMFWPRAWEPRTRWIVAGAILVLVGPFAAARVDTYGLERNPLFALLRTAIPRVQAQTYVTDWRATPVRGEDRVIHQLARKSATHDVALDGLISSARGMNVLLVVLESTAARYLRTYGAAEDPMPNVTALAARSIVFENTYAVYPESVKGLVSILASRYPGFDLAAERHASVMKPSVATALEHAGYRTGLFHSGRFFYLGMDALVAGSGFGRTADAGDIGGNRNSSFGIDEQAAVRHVLQWIDSKRGDQPFFAAYLPIAGHHPYAYSLPGPFDENDEVGRYRNALHEADHALGELLEGLKARGLDGKTIVVVIGDHGEAFGQHHGNYGHNLALYDENVRVPFLVALPGQAQTKRIAEVASLVDVVPTVLDLIGVKRPAEFEGESLLRPRERIALFFTDYSLGLLGLRDGCWKMIHELESGRSKLFDLCVDPTERNNLASNYAGQVERYRERLKRWSAAQVAALTVHQ